MYARDFCQMHDILFLFMVIIQAQWLNSRCHAPHVALLDCLTSGDSYWRYVDSDFLVDTTARETDNNEDVKRLQPREGGGTHSLLNMS